MRVLALLAAALLLAACSTTTTAPPPGAGISAAARGTSCENAVVIEARNESEGIKREMDWIRQNYPGAKKESQDLLQCNGKAADAIHIVTSNGEKVVVYFDISGWFGKW